MTTDPQPTSWTVDLLLDLFDVEPDGQDRFIAQSGLAAGAELERRVSALTHHALPHPSFPR